MKSKVLFITLGILSISVIVLGGATGFLLSSKPQFPKSKIVEGLSLNSARKVRPLSPLWAKFIETPPKILTNYNFISNWKKLLVKEHGWYRKLQQVQPYLSQSEMAYQEFKKALTSTGCPPAADLQRERFPSYIYMVRGTKYLGLRALYQIQQGQPDIAAKELLWAMTRIQPQLQHCQLSLIFVMVWVAVHEHLLTYLRYALTHPKLSISVRNKVLLRLKASENPTLNPMGEALRSELEFQQHHLRQFNAGKQQTAKPALMTWPWWDYQNTKKFLLYFYAPKIHRASLPLNADFWEVYPEEKAVLRIQTQFKNRSNWTEIFQYNVVGIRFFAIGIPSVEKYILRWHQSLCVTAATRAWGVQQAQKFKQLVPPDLAKITNPITHKPFGDLRKPVCKIVNPLTKKTVLRGKRVSIQPLPQAHPTTPAKSLKK